MSPTRAAPGKRAAPAWDDTRLVKECLRGSEEAWSLLVDKYKALIYSIPVKYGLPPHEAADVFQSTCAELLVRLADLRVLVLCFRKEADTELRAQLIERGHMKAVGH